MPLLNAIKLTPAGTALLVLPSLASCFFAVHATGPVHICVPLWITSKQLGHLRSLSYTSASFLTMPNLLACIVSLRRHQLSSLRA